MVAANSSSKFISIFALMQLISSTTAFNEDKQYTVNLTEATGKQNKVNDILKEVYAIIAKNIPENSRKLILEDFSWAILGGTKGRLEGFSGFQMVNNHTASMAQKQKFNTSFEFTVPILRATWAKSVCLGYSCVLTMELKNAVFALRILFNARECVVDHLAYLKTFDNVKCYTSFLESSAISYGIVATTVGLLSKVMNTQPFEQIIKNNVNYALLQLPLFDVADIARICEAYKQI